MKGEIDKLIRIAEVEKINFSLNKFVKYANHLAIEFTRNPYIEEGDKRGARYVMQLIEECFSRKMLTSDERNNFYSGEINIEEIVFIILEIFISQGYFTVEDYGISDSSNSISFIYAWNTYIRLGKALGKGTIDIPSIYIDTGKLNVFTKEQLKNQKHIDVILDDDDQDEDEYDDYMDLDEYPFFELIQQGIDILLNPRDLGSELENFDYERLIQLIVEYDILNPNEAKELMDFLNSEGSKKGDIIIFRLFQAFYNSGIIDEIDIDDQDREILKNELRYNYYVLGMLYIDEIPTQ